LTLIGNLVRTDPAIPALQAVLAPWGALAGASSTNRPSVELAFSFALIALLAGVEWVQANRAPAQHPEATGWGRWLRRDLGQSVYIRWAIYLALALAILNLGVRQGTPFVYMQF
jgi:hypothetical protein